jgi:hypothetical protein
VVQGGHPVPEDCVDVVRIPPRRSEPNPLPFPRNLAVATPLSLARAIAGVRSKRRRGVSVRSPSARRPLSRLPWIVKSRLRKVSL